MKIKNSPINIGFYKLQEHTAKKRLKSNALKKKKDSAVTQLEKNRIDSQLKQLNIDVENYQNDLKATYKNTFFERLIILMQPPPKPIISDKINKPSTYHYYKNNFWNSINITDPGLLRTPILNAKINDYLDNVIMQQSDSVIKEVDQLIAKASSSKEAFRYVLITLINKYESSPVIDFDKVFVHLIEKYYLTGQADAWTSKETRDQLQRRVDMIKPNFLGKNAPELILRDTLGNKINLRDIDAKFTILYFYDPDCSHCKKKTPMLYEMYPNLVAKGVEILAICTATDEKKWKDFIIKEDLGWINLADLESKTDVKYYYDIQSIPTIYILDKNKKIILKKISAEKIPPIIDTLINKKGN
jgi:peroxiredoxin